MDGIGPLAVTVRLPPLDELAARWAEIAPLLERATRRTGCYEPIDLLRMALVGQAGIWLCQHGISPIDAAIVTEVKQYPRKRVLEVLFAGGYNMGLWMETAIRAIDAHATATGCSHIASVGRPGWARAWRARATGDVVLVRDIGA